MVVFSWLAVAAMRVCVAGGIDHVVTYDNSGIWNRNAQQALLYTLVGGEIAGALWEGGESRLGKTFWQSIDSSAIGAVSSEALKHIFTRARPDQSSDPNLWFQGHGHYSFPSGEVTTVSAIVPRVTASIRSSMISCVTPMKRLPPVMNPMAARSGVSKKSRSGRIEGARSRTVKLASRLMSRRYAK